MTEEIRICPRCLLDKPLSQFRGRRQWARYSLRLCLTCRELIANGTREERMRNTAQINHRRISSYFGKNSPQSNTSIADEWLSHALTGVMDEIDKYKRVSHGG
jgi:hypothetical protein